MRRLRRLRAGVVTSGAVNVIVIVEHDCCFVHWRERKRFGAERPVVLA
jgi:hypothetical protein